MDERSVLERVESVLGKAFEGLGIQVPPKKSEAIAKMVVHSMSNENRSFHRTNHALELVDPADFILNLAALFHDIVYFQVDEGLPALAESLLTQVVQNTESGLVIKDDILRSRPEFGIVFEIFGLAAGHKLNPMAGQNEFLSAVVAFDCLSPLLKADVLVQICACIEATIPFRKRDRFDPVAKLDQTLRLCNLKYRIGLSEESIIQTMRRAVDLANRDVKNFASEDPSWFLATTWQLLPERNVKLRGDQYTIGDYRQSQEKMAAFFEFLNVEMVFKQAYGSPNDLVLKAQKAEADKNISLAREYLRVKLVAIGILEAIAVETGGDLSMSKMLGKVRKSGERGLRMEDFLPEPATIAKHNPMLLDLMRRGRAFETTFDLRNSPLAAFVYEQVGDTGIETLSEWSKRYFAGQATTEEFLRQVPLYVLTSIANSCAEICPSRAAALKQLTSRLKSAA